MADANYPMAAGCQEAFNSVKDPRSPIHFVIFKVEHEQITIDRVAEAEATYTDFVGMLPSNDPRFCIYDYNYQNEEGHARSKLLFIFWSPDTVPPRTKMVYATGVKGFVRRFQGIQKEIQATDMSEVQAQAIESSLRFS